jgi:4-hydroxybenzoate polyprenyltransferase
MIVKAKDFFKAIRLQNILIIDLALIIFFYYTVLNKNNLSNSTSDLLISIVITSLIAAAGYLHNNLLDRELDQKHKMKHIKLVQNVKTTKLIILIFNMMGIGISAYIYWKFDNENYLLISILSFLLLHFYNRYIKKTPLLGNLIVALLCVMPFFIPILNKVNYNLDSSIYSKQQYILISIFFISLVREIVKDLEDMRFDIFYKYKTFPILFGRWATIALVFLICVGYAVLAYYLIFQSNQWTYLTTMMPVFGSMILLTMRQYKQSSQMYLLTLIYGVVTMFWL